MRTTRLVAGSVTAAIVFGSVGLAAPSSARDTWTTTTVASLSESTVEYGDVISVEFDVDSQGDYPPTDGTSTLLVRRAGTTRWKEVASTSSLSGQFTRVKPRMSSTYKVVYSGYEAASTKSDSYASSQSAELAVQVSRRITYPEKGFELTGRVTPGYARKKIVVKVSREQNAGYKRYKKITTNARGRYRITLPRRGGTWYWSFLVRGDERYAATSFVWKTFVG